MGFLDNGGLSHLMSKIKTLVNGKAEAVHEHTSSEISDVDAIPVNDSTKVVASGGVYSMLQSIVVNGDVTGDTTFDGSRFTITTAVADDSHNHTIENVDDLQSALDAKQVKHSAITVSLASGATSWAVTAAGVTASNTVIVSPAPASMEAYAAAGVTCTAQEANSLTFTASDAPSEALTVNVVILD